LVGTIIGHYKLTRQLGQGGMGTVFEAVHDQLGRRVAIKVMKPEYASDPEALQRLFNEARAVNVIEHPGLVQISEFGQTPDGSAYLIMELLRGDTLSSRLRRAGGRISEKVGVSIAGQLAAVLMAAHTKGIVHRDVLLIDSDCPRSSGKTTQRRRQHHEDSLCRQSTHFHLSHPIRSF
jgi:serine/threonine protein kinase